MTDALDYAATGSTGYNFYDARGRLQSVLTYGGLRDNARAMASRLSGLGLARGERVAIIADTSPEFIVLFFACRYAGLAPFAMPVPVNLGSHHIYVRQLKGMLEVSNARVAVANRDYSSFLDEAVEGLERAFADASLVRTDDITEALFDLRLALEMSEGQKLGGKSAEAARLIGRRLSRLLDEA